MSEGPEIVDWGKPLGSMYLYRVDLYWEVFTAYKRQITPEESGYRILTHVWDAMMDWCHKNVRGNWWTDNILSLAFADEGDAIRFKLTFMRPNHTLDHMFTARKQSYSEH